MSKTFYYHLKSTTDENVGTIEADNNDDAMAKLSEQYAPPHPYTGKPHKGIEITIIDKKQYSKDQTRIAEERTAAANATDE